MKSHSLLRMLAILLTLIISASMAFAEPSVYSPGGLFSANPAPRQAHHLPFYQIQKMEARAAISDREPWLGLVGDSGITGAMTLEKLNLRIPRLVFGWVIPFYAWESTRTISLAQAERSPFAQNLGLQGSLSPLTRVLYSQEEFYRARNESAVVSLNWEAKIALRTDVPEYGFGYLVGRALGILPERIVLAAQNGRSIEEMAKQFRRFSEVSETLPSDVIVSFTANDFCGDEIDQPLEKFQTDFKRKLKSEWRKVLETEKPHPTLGTRVIAMAPFDVISAIIDKDLLTQTVGFIDGPDLQCSSVRLHTRSQAWGALGRWARYELSGMCRGILRTDPNDTERVEKIKALQRTQIQIWQEVLSELPQTPGWSFHFSQATQDVQLVAGDLANDCFHPGTRLHSKVAEQLFRTLPERASAPSTAGP